MTSALWRYNSTTLLILAQASILCRHNSTPLLILAQASAWCQCQFISLFFVDHHPIIGNISTLSSVIYRRIVSGRVHSSPTFWVSSTQNKELKSVQINRHSPLPTIHYCILPTLATCFTCNVSFSNLWPTSQLPTLSIFFLTRVSHICLTIWLFACHHFADYLSLLLLVDYFSSLGHEPSSQSYKHIIKLLSCQSCKHIIKLQSN